MREKSGKQAEDMDDVEGLMGGRKAHKCNSQGSYKYLRQTSIA